MWRDSVRIKFGEKRIFMRDKLGRNINYLRISLTDRCNLRCIYCMPETCENLYENKKYLSTNEVNNLVKCASKLGIEKVRYTGGEPLVRNDISKIIYETNRIDGIRDISLTTNGILLKDMAKELKSCGLNRVNISLDTLNKEKFNNITRGGNLDKVIEAIYECLRLGITPIKINAVVIDNVNYDDVYELINLTKELPVEVRFIEIMPIGEGAKYYKEGFISLEQLKSNLNDITPILSKNQSVAEIYKVNGAKGSIGFISPLSCNFCSDCNKIRITSTGKVKQCLHSREEIDIRQYMDDQKLLLKEMKRVILEKPDKHKLNLKGVSDTNRKMYQIGG